MTLNPLFVKLFAVLSAISVMKGCSPAEPGTYKNDKIPSWQRDDLHALNTQLLDGLRTNAPRQVEAVMCREYIEDNGRLRLIELCSNRLKEDAYTLLDEYYIVHKEKGKKTLESGPGPNSYTLDYTADAREMYIAFFVPKSIANKYMIQATYCKLDYGWKLTHLEVDPYAFNGKSAPELFEKAKEMYGKKYLLDAVNDIQMARTCATPCEGWKYRDESQMAAFYSTLIDKANMKMVYPFTLSEVPTRPRIFSISTITTPEGVFPQVFYMSTVKLSDASGLKKENENIKKVIGKAIPGIDQDKKYVYYDAFNEWPRSDRSVDRVDLIDKLK
jgi:hypothetical protein